MKNIFRPLSFLILFFLVHTPTMASDGFFQVTLGGRVTNVPYPVDRPQSKNSPMTAEPPPPVGYLDRDSNYEACDSSNCYYLKAEARDAFLRSEQQFQYQQEASLKEEHKKALLKADEEIRNLSSGSISNDGIAATQLNKLRNDLAQSQKTLADTQADLSRRRTQYNEELGNEAEGMLEAFRQNFPSLDPNTFVTSPEITRLQQLNDFSGSQFGTFADRLPFSSDAQSPEGQELRVLADRSATYRGMISKENFSYSEQRLELVNAADSALITADKAYVQGDSEGYTQYKEAAVILLDTALSFTPGVSFARDCYEAVTGRNLVTGEELDTFDRSMAVLGAVTGGLGSKIKNVSKGIEVVTDLMKGVARSEEGIAKVVRVSEKAKDVIDSAKNAKAVKIPYETGEALQEITSEALKVRAKVDSGAPLYRVGTRGRSQTGAQAQFWSHENPLSPGYAERYGIPPENLKNMDFLETATLKDGTNYITRKAPSYGSNPGGAIEVVVPEGGVIIKSHVSL